MTHISRRTVLRGVGVSLALPLLEAMVPTSVLAAAPGNMKTPTRMAFLYVPNGVQMEDWTPKKEGADYELTKTLTPLKAFKDDLLVLTGLTADKARPNGDGPGDHARAMSAFLTGAQPKKTAGANIKVGVPADQLVAQKVGGATKFASLEIGCEGGRTAGNCDSGYSCAYSSTIAWRTESSPVPKETNARLVFDRLFNGGKGGSEYKRSAYKKSLLDFVAEDAKALEKQLGGADKRKLDEYLTGVREIETRLAKAEKATAEPTKVPDGYKLPTGSPKHLGEHIRLLGDMMVLAFQADLTRVCTFVFANEGSNRPYRNEISVSEGHHDLSHHGRKAEKQAKIQKINTFHIEQLAYVVKKLAEAKEGDRRLLDSCMIAYGSGNSDGNAHNHDNLPLLLIGKGNGTLKTGRHVKFRRNTPLNNLWLEMMDRMGVKEQRFGDSTGRLSGLK